MNVSVRWEVDVLKRGVTLGIRMLTSFIGTPNVAASHHIRLCCFWQLCKMRKGLQSNGQETCAQVLALRESKKEACGGLKHCSKEGSRSGEQFTKERKIHSGVGDKTLFKSTFQGLTNHAWFTSDLSCLNLQRANGWTCLPSYQRHKITCLSFMKDRLKVLVFLYLPLELKVVTGSSHLSRNRSLGVWQSHVLELNPRICRLTIGSACTF